MYAVLGVGAALENLFPPVPADTFVVIGAFLSARGYASAQVVFWLTWSSNTVAAGLVYGAGRKYGEAFFVGGVGRRLLNQGQMHTIRGFYDRYGTWAIFFTRFLPGLRAIVPVFAGVSQQGFFRVMISILVASAIWHAGLVVLGVQAGLRLEVVLGMLSGVNAWLVGVAGVIGAAVFVWWWRTRRGEG